MLDLKINDLHFSNDRTDIYNCSAVPFRHDGHYGLAHTENCEGIRLKDLFDIINRLFDKGACRSE